MSIEEKLFEIFIEKPTMKHETTINNVANFLLQPICILVMCLAYVAIFILMVINNGL